MNTALQLITKKVHTIWSENKKRITLLLNLNVFETFDNVSHVKLLHNMRKKRVSTRLLAWVKDFLKKRRITLTIDDYTQAERNVTIEISQKSSLLSILYLFYNADLLEVCNNIRFWTNVTEFVDDVNILIYNESTKRNCQMLKKTYNKCERWAQKHNSKFAERKHELIHFSRIFKRFNMSVSVTLNEHEINIKSDIKVLEVQLNFKLRWRSHLRQIEAKLIVRHKTAQIIIDFTWDSTITTNKRIYFIMSRSAINHEAVVWYTSTNIKNHRKTIDAKLRFIQSKELRQITKIYKTTFTKTLQMKINTTSIDIHLKKLLQRSIINMNVKNSRKTIETIVTRIKHDINFRKDRRSKLKTTSLKLKRK